ncbi:MAG: hypothetical protein ACLPWG_09100 [Steroidobacteraceae bacterium]
MVDAAGVPQQRGLAFASLFEVSAAPIFSLYESELGHGVVGGPYHSQQRGGERYRLALFGSESAGAAPKEKHRR